MQRFYEVFIYMSNFFNRINPDILTCLQNFHKLNYRSMEAQLSEIISFMLTSDVCKTVF